MNTKDVQESNGDSMREPETADRVGISNRKARRPLTLNIPARDPDDERWERLLASPASKKLLKKMAAEALEDKRAERTQDFPIYKKS